jgi:hypothetical protein
MKQRFAQQPAGRPLFDDDFDAMLTALVESPA